MNLDFALIITVLTLLTGLIWLFDVLVLKPRRQDPAAESKLVEYARSFFPVLLLVLIFRSFLFEPFKIPSKSMVPTLLVGDFIVVNKYIYGLRLPVLNTKIVPVSEPERGEVVVFRKPNEEHINMIKRVVGLPGDTVTVRNKQLYINGEAVPTEHKGRYRTSDNKCDRPRLGIDRYQEMLGEHGHDILLDTRHGNRVREGSWQVPEGHYFMMGDNRDDSLDSRAWGFVPEDHLVGRAAMIWLNIDVGEGCMDWSRVGDSIN